MRLDIYLTKYHTIQSRNKASELIKSKKVTVDNKIITKPSFEVDEFSKIKIDTEDFFVSRAALKLKYFLEECDVKIDSKEVLDIGSSTGGFTQILLQNEASSVTCVDVGSHQLHPFLVNDPRIIIKENQDIRDFFPHKQYDLVTCDVSFISVLKIIDAIDRLAKREVIILFKPQFEVGKECKRDKNGVVLDLQEIENVTKIFIQKIDSLGWKLQYRAKSKIAGKSGNVEELFYCTK